MLKVYLDGPNLDYSGYVSDAGNVKSPWGLEQTSERSSSI